MDTSIHPIPDVYGETRPQQISLVLCPACAGPMLPLRGLWSCQRCGMPLCLGCESDEGAINYPQRAKHD